MTWIRTYSGGKFDFANPNPDDIHIRDIAHALSHTARFSGHTFMPYSVAQHSVLVSKSLTDEHKLAGLLHDATEAYMSDISRPLKQMLPEYQAIENRVGEVIAAKFGFAWPLPSWVKHADNTVLRWEMRDLVPESREWQTWNHNLPRERITPWRPKVAEIEFMFQFKKLTEWGNQ